MKKKQQQQQKQAPTVRPTAAIERQFERKFKRVLKSNGRRFAREWLEKLPSVIGRGKKKREINLPTAKWALRAH